MCLLTLKPVSWAHTSLLNIPSHQAQEGEQSIGVLSPKEQRPPPYASLRTSGSPDSGPRPITMSHCAVDSRGCPALGPPVLVSAPSPCRVLPLTGNCSRQQVLTLSPVEPVHLPLLHHQQHASTVASPRTPSAATLTLRVHTLHSLPSRHPCLEAGSSPTVRKVPIPVSSPLPRMLFLPGCPICVPRRASHALRSPPTPASLSCTLLLASVLLCKNSQVISPRESSGDVSTCSLMTSHGDSPRCGCLCVTNAWHTDSSVSHHF